MNSISEFDRNGYCVSSPLFGERACEALGERLASVAISMAGSRSLLEEAWCASLAHELRGHPLLVGLLPPDFVAVQCTFFEKSVDRNWLVSLHQDLSIPVRRRLDHPALTGWSEKQGAFFVQPPAAVLEKLVAVRLHVDACGPGDGPLKVVPGSHVHGEHRPGPAPGGVAEWLDSGELAEGAACLRLQKRHNTADARIVQTQFDDMELFSIVRDVTGSIERNLSFPQGASGPLVMDIDPIMRLPDINRSMTVVGAVFPEGGYRDSEGSYFDNLKSLRCQRVPSTSLARVPMLLTLAAGVSHVCNPPPIQSWTWSSTTNQAPERRR